MPQTTVLKKRRTRPSKNQPKVMSEKEFDDLVETFCMVIKSYGEFILGIGTIEKKHPEALKTVDVMLTPEMLNQMVKSTPPEIVGKLVKVLLQFTSISPQIQNFEKLDPQGKINMGKTLIQLSSDLRELASSVA